MNLKTMTELIRMLDSWKEFGEKSDERGVELIGEDFYNRLCPWPIIIQNSVKGVFDPDDEIEDGAKRLDFMLNREIRCEDRAKGLLGIPENTESTDPDDYPFFIKLFSLYKLREIGKREFEERLGVKRETLEKLMKEYMKRVEI